MDAYVTEDTFEENLALWEEHHPKEAVKLTFFEPARFAFTLAEGQLNLIDRESRALFYPKNPLESESQWVHSLHLANEEVIVIYGIGLGYHYLAAKEWLKLDARRTMIFIEDDLEMLFYFFYTPCARQLLEDAQAHLFYFESLTESTSVFNALYLKYLSKPFSIHCSSYYENIKKAAFERFALNMYTNAQVIPVSVEEYHHYGAAFFRNYYANLPHLARASLTNGLFGQFKGVPAVICGAGPSLEKHLPLLKKIKENALIFGGSSAMNALLEAGITPHFGGGIDPNTTQAKRYQQLKKRDFPLIYRGRLYYEALSLWEGPLLYTTGAGGYDLASWVEKQLGIEPDEFEEGHNIVNFFLEVALRMGCNPVIFVGMDLAYSGGKEYAAGVDSLDDPKLFKGDLVEHLDIFGKPVQTDWKWIAESEWITHVAGKHTDVQLINATEGGIGFRGVKNCSFEEVINQYLKKNHAVSSRVDHLIKTAKLNISFENIDQLKTTLKNSLKRVIKGLEVLLQVESTSPKALLILNELEKEESYQAVLRTFNAFITFYLESLSEETDDRAPLLKKKYQFLLEVAEVNLALL